MCLSGTCTLVLASSLALFVSSILYEDLRHIMQFNTKQNRKTNLIKRQHCSQDTEQDKTSLCKQFQRHAWFIPGTDTHSWKVSYHGVAHNKYRQVRVARLHQVNVLKGVSDINLKVLNGHSVTFALAMANCGRKNQESLTHYLRPSKTRKLHIFLGKEGKVAWYKGNYKSRVIAYSSSTSWIKHKTVERVTAWE